MLCSLDNKQYNLATQTTIAEWESPDPSTIGEDHIEFLKKLNGPTWITLEGKDNSRSRAIVTLLHGNEPSGLKMVHEFLKSAGKPATNLGIFIGAVDAALYPPFLSHRYLSDEMDLNRCFAPPYRTNQGMLAEKLLQILEDFSPEAIVPEKIEISGAN